MDAKTSENLHILTVKRSEPLLVRPPLSGSGGRGNGCSDYYHVSAIDKAYANCFFAILYAYAPPLEPTAVSMTAVMRESLASVLVLYHPLAGRITRGDDGILAVKLNGEGVMFVEAEAGCTLAEISIAEPDILTLDDLIYPQSTSFFPEEVQLKMPLLLVQVTKFRCGGCILGLLINHIIMDGIATVEFVNSWAEVARGIPISNPPFLVRTILNSRSPLKPEFSLIELQDDLQGFLKGSNVNIDDYANKNHQKRIQMGMELPFTSLWFDPDQLNDLKSKASTINGKDCTTFEALATLVWKIWVTVKAFTCEEHTKLVFAVNIRKRFDTPLPSGYFGNAFISAKAECQVGELLEKPLAFGARLVREAVQQVTDSHIRNVIDYLQECPSTLPHADGHTLIVTSWANFNFWAADFGWDQPILANMGVMLPPMAMAFIPGTGGKGLFVKLNLPLIDTIKFKELIHTYKSST